MAAIWKGSLTFGLVNIPIELKTAVRADHISFRLLHEQDLSPVKYERICQKEGEPVPWNEIVKGYEYEKGKFVVLTDADFKAAALEHSKTIDILDFVKEGEIDPRYFETPYYLVPGKGGDKPYALLREAIRQTGSVGIGKIIIRQTQHLVGVKVIGDALVLEIMRFANELVDASDFNFPSRDAVRPQELQMAEQLVGNLAEPKMKGKKPKLEEPEGEPADSGVLDLMSRLRASLEEGSRKEGATRTKRKSVAAHRKPVKAKKAKTA